MFPNIVGLGLSSKEAENLLLEKYGVAALAGTSFGQVGTTTNGATQPESWTW